MDISLVEQRIRDKIETNYRVRSRRIREELCAIADHTDIQKEFFSALEEGYAGYEAYHTDDIHYLLHEDYEFVTNYFTEKLASTELRGLVYIQLAYGAIMILPHRNLLPAELYNRSIIQRPYAPELQQRIEALEEQQKFLQHLFRKK